MNGMVVAIVIDERLASTSTGKLYFHVFCALAEFERDLITERTLAGLEAAHTRTIYTKPLTFTCAKCNQVTTRDVYPGHPPKYCLKCSPRKKRREGDTRPPERGDFEPTHNLVDSTGKVTLVALETAPEKGW